MVLPALLGDTVTCTTLSWSQASGRQVSRMRSLGWKLRVSPTVPSADS